VIATISKIAIASTIALGVIAAQAKSTNHPTSTTTTSTSTTAGSRSSGAGKVSAHKVAKTKSPTSTRTRS
jgi:hypothetical protein